MFTVYSYVAIVIISIIIPSCWSIISDVDEVPTPSGSATITYITTSANYAWVVDANGTIYVCDNPCTGGWTQVSGGLQLVQVDASISEVWGVSADGKGYKHPVDGSGSDWTQVSAGGLTHVSASGYGYIWGVLSFNIVVKCKMPCSGEWELVRRIRLAQLDAGPDRVYGVNLGGYVLTRPVDGSGSWQHIPGILKHITVGLEYLYGVSYNNYFYRCATPCLDGGWELLNDDGHIIQSEASYNYLYLLTDAGAIYRSTSNEH